MIAAVKKQKPRLLVSACLLGRKVRYDGAHQKQSWLDAKLRADFIILPVCPEVEMGLGVPRDTLRLVRSRGDRSACPKLIVTRTGRDLTQLALRFTAKFLNELQIDGAILKSRSPSCGLKRVKLYSSSQPSANGREVGFRRVARGLFASQLRRKYPRLPLADEVELADRHKRAAFLDRVIKTANRRALRETILR